jgi:hypothetical protein
MIFPGQALFGVNLHCIMIKRETGGRIPEGSNGIFPSASLHPPSQEGDEESAIPSA